MVAALIARRSEAVRPELEKAAIKTGASRTAARRAWPQLAGQADQNIRPSTMARRVAAILYAHRLAGQGHPDQKRPVAAIQSNAGRRAPQGGDAHPDGA